MAPELDRAFGKPNHNTKGRMLATLLGSIVVVSSIMATLVTSSHSEPDSPASNAPVHILYATHNPIYIDGNAGFEGPNASTGIVWGDGTEEDPYVIEGWDIDASSADGIFIRNADVHFIIRSCYLHDGGSNYNGTHLNNTSNGTVMNNYCSNNYEGIFLWSSNNNTLFNNTCNSNNDNGIFLWLSCYDNTLSNNSCTLNYWGGIFLLSSCNRNTICNNNCSDYYEGITLAISSNNILSNNTCLNDTFGIIIEDSSSGNTISNNNCSDGGSAGIFIYDSISNKVIRNIASGGLCGIYLWTDSNNNTLTYNTCLNNSQYGIQIETSDSNTLSNNIASDNIIHGIYVVASDGNTLSNNNCTHNNDYGIMVFGSNRNELIGNNVSDNKYGIHLWSASNTTVTCNTISNNTIYGIRVNSASRNNISYNTISNNGQYAVYVLMPASINNRFWNNTFYHNRGSGDTYDPTKIQVYDSGTNTVWNTSGSPHGYGNYWSDWTIPDLNGNGIVDNQYNLSGGKGANDSYPLTTPSAPPFIPEFSEMIIPIVGLMLITWVFGRARESRKRV